MTQSSIFNSKTTKQPRSAAILLLYTALDTTLRAFVPTIGGTFIGIWLDHSFNSAPIWTTIMIILGFIISAILVMLQMKSVRNTK